MPRVVVVVVVAVVVVVVGAVVVVVVGAEVVVAGLDTLSTKVVVDGVVPTVDAVVAAMECPAPIATAGSIPPQVISHSPRVSNRFKLPKHPP